MAINQYSLISLDEIKGFLLMTGAASDVDDLLEDLINRTSTIFESYMNRHILSREYTEYHDGKGLSVLFPRQPKITAITSIHDDGDWVWIDADLISSDDYRIVEDSYVVFNNITLGNYKQNIKLVYTAGYDTTPDDLKQAMVTEVSRLYKNKNSMDVVSKTLSDGSISYSGEGFLTLTMLTLNNYRRVVVV